MFPSYLPVKAPDPGAYHFNFLGHNQKCLTLRYLGRFKNSHEKHPAFLQGAISIYLIPFTSPHPPSPQI